MRNVVALLCIYVIFSKECNAVNLSSFVYEAPGLSNQSALDIEKCVREQGRGPLSGGLALERNA